VLPVVLVLAAGVAVWATGLYEKLPFFAGGGVSALPPGVQITEGDRQTPAFTPMTPAPETPESSAPESPAPESSTPESSAPESSTPESSTSESSAPETPEATENAVTLGIIGGDALTLSESSWFGVYVREVNPDSAAEWAGLRVGDVIVALDGYFFEKGTGDALDFAERLKQYREGDSAELVTQRGDQTLYITVTFGETSAQSEETAPLTEGGYADEAYILYENYAGETLRDLLARDALGTQPDSSFQTLDLYLIRDTSAFSNSLLAFQYAEGQEATVAGVWCATMDLFGKWDMTLEELRILFGDTLLVEEFYSELEDRTIISVSLDQYGLNCVLMNGNTTDTYSSLYIYPAVSDQ
jgi:hypothetical protein